ncbi:MAG: MoaD/ThiS family protein [Gaiellaceae bacterium]
MADVRLPGTLTPLFPGLPRRLEIEAATVLGAIDQLETQWPGLRDRLVGEGPTLRSHIHAYVDGERSGLDTPIAGDSRLDVIAAISGG